MNVQSDKLQGITSFIEKLLPNDIPDLQTMARMNLGIWELTQPEEENFTDNELTLGDFDNGRWITVDEEDAGREDEKVLFRSFVNASIGAKGTRMRTKGAPYMLLLSTKEGLSEPQVTICNQSGTLGLTRDCKSNSIF